MSEKPLVDIEGKVKQIFNVSEKAYAYQRQPLKVKETVMDEATQKQHERITER